MHPHRKNYVRIVLIYIVLGINWVLLSDRLIVADELIGDLTKDDIYWFNLTKGIAYVLFTALLLYFLLQNSSKKLGIARQKIGEHEAHIEFVLNSTDEIIWSVDAKKQFIVYNQSFSKIYENLTSEKSKPENGHADYSSVDKFNKKWSLRYDDALLGNEALYEDTETLTNGSFIYLETLVNPMMVNGDIKGVVCLARDISKTKQYKSEIAEQNQTIKEISWSAAHEFRSKIVTIQGLAQSLQLNSESDNKDELRGIIETSAELDTGLGKLIEKTE